jgi:hypothetical protein
MARGWESKSVESQMESAEAHVRPSSVVHLEAVELDLLRKKGNLMLSRTRVLRELETSRNPRYRSQLEKALTDLNAELLRLEPGNVRTATA